MGDKIAEAMKELNDSYRKKDWGNMCNIVKLELLDLLEEKASEVE